VKLRRGFKTEANEIAGEIRRELRLARSAPLSPWKLADHLEIPVVTLSSMRDLIPDAALYFLNTNRSEFSAVTVFRGVERTILHNDSHSAGRQASNLAHELSHALLLHPATPPIDALGCRDWDPLLEEEAEWLAGSLLISDEAALHIVRTEMPTDEAREEYGVSSKMLQFRLNVTGARVRVARSQDFVRRRVSGLRVRR
jgi:Zn-dependent peptidase ImmA (M78 family)